MEFNVEGILLNPFFLVCFIVEVSGLGGGGKQENFKSHLKFEIEIKIHLSTLWLQIIAQHLYMKNNLRTMK